MKHIHNLRPLALAFILVVTGIAAAVCGLVMKGQLQKYVGGYDDKWAVAVPFLMLRDDTDWQRMLAAKNAPAPDPQPDPEPAPEPEPEPDPEPEPEPQPPVVVTNAVYGQDESFFDDALFIGDSRMVNVANYARLGNADYFADVGMTVFKMFSTTASDKDFGATDLASLLRSREYSHIFIMLGLNEAGYPLGNLFDAYQEDLDQLCPQPPDGGEQRLCGPGRRQQHPLPGLGRVVLRQRRLHAAGIHRRRRPPLWQIRLFLLPVAV